MKLRTFHLLIVAFAVSITVAQESKEESYKIGYQDTLEITVFRHPELTQLVNISPDGTIKLFRIDTPIRAVCKTERELAAEITEKYKTYLKNPFVNVRVVEQRSQYFAVIGAVERPGLFYINRRVRLLELLSFAGGPDTEKAGTKLIVARAGSTATCDGKAQETRENYTLYQFNVRDVLQAKENIWMEPGDIVSVLDADVVYVYGNVRKPGAIKLNRALTLRQAIASAEGFAPASNKDKIRLIRQKPGQAEWEEQVFSLKDIDNGKVTDPLLQPNDIIAVSEDKTQSILNGIGKSLTGGLANLPIFVK
ncbi:MAG: polysaccharide export protein [Pyrinomonadaceae bacterium]|nr:polysaccharide export protein [Pyrinomonadaceae bacterium]MCX7640671.1 polysaccharide export protein [Pyrinomonadaceae bacterium]MDW8305052.1 polysaccharide biosynthesis/export family protein [Acidobacteriota bacterium]